MRAMEEEKEKVKHEMESTSPYLSRCAFLSRSPSTILKTPILFFLRKGKEKEKEKEKERSISHRSRSSSGGRRGMSDASANSSPRNTVLLLLLLQFNTRILQC